MAPLHDTDVATERWNQSEWRSYELWEKVEQRNRRRRNLWIAGTAFVFLALSSIPIIRDRGPKWRSLSAIRQLSQEINAIKTLAAVQHAAFRVRLEGDSGLKLSVERLSSCQAGDAVPVRTVALRGASPEDYQWVGPEHASRVGLTGLVREFCYDYLGGSGALQQGKELAAFGVMPVKDLTEGRSDRIALLILSGPSAEVSFE